MENLKLQRIVLEVFGGCNYTCQMCPQSHPGRGKNFNKKMRIEEFEKILDKIVPKYGKPLINLEGSGMVGIPGFSQRLFHSLSSNNININYAIFNDLLPLQIIFHQPSNVNHFR